MPGTHSRILALSLGLGLIAAMLLARPIIQPSGASEGGQTLSPEAMGRIWGASACKDCRYVGARLDECYHDGFADPCDPEGCIANYVIDYTCDPGTGTCTAVRDNTAVGSVQYYRADSECATNNPYAWTTWMTHYYGADCLTFKDGVRCQKTNGSCNGTLIDTSARNPGFYCR